MPLSDDVHRTRGPRENPPGSADIASLTTLMSGDMMAKAREGYIEEQKSWWSESVQQSNKEEMEEFRGIRFEAYILPANK